MTFVFIVAALMVGAAVILVISERPWAREGGPRHRAPSRTARRLQQVREWRVRRALGLRGALNRVEAPAPHYLRSPRDTGPLPASSL